MVFPSSESPKSSRVPEIFRWTMLNFRALPHPPFDQPENREFSRRCLFFLFNLQTYFGCVSWKWRVVPNKPMGFFLLKMIDQHLGCVLWGGNPPFFKETPIYNKGKQVGEMLSFDLASQLPSLLLLREACDFLQLVIPCPTSCIWNILEIWQQENPGWEFEPLRFHEWFSVLIS